MKCCGSRMRLARFCTRFPAAGWRNTGGGGAALLHPDVGKLFQPESWPGSAPLAGGRAAQRRCTREEKKKKKKKKERERERDWGKFQGFGEFWGKCDTCHLWADNPSSQNCIIAHFSNFFFI
ncbi:hypothetical protein TorRG33x02_257420 [Trema orientale]|uniref:Uncharacterized protein n=1 Tax=Trema orientale TaxID=63057 RepID=A0A2P5DA88_TREOI|nr:hypothetical protein TorRG33x02_257420 [Trema orientale]